MAKRQDAPRSPENGGLLGGGLALGTGLFRLVPHLPNFTPVGALGLFAGARMRLWQALTIPLVVMAVSDLLLQRVYGLSPFHPFVYASVIANVMLGRLLLRGSTSPWRIGTVSLLASAQFFLVTNLGVWLAWPHVLKHSDWPAALLRCRHPVFPVHRVGRSGVLRSHVWRARLGKTLVGSPPTGRAAAYRGHHCLVDVKALGRLAHQTHTAAARAQRAGSNHESRQHQPERGRLGDDAYANVVNTLIDILR